MMMMMIDADHFKKNTRIQKKASEDTRGDDESHVEVSDVKKAPRRNQKSLRKLAREKNN